MNVIAKVLRSYFNHVLNFGGAFEVGLRVAPFEGAAILKATGFAGGLLLNKIYLFLLGLPKTVLFNLRYFPIRNAIRLPVFVSHRVWLKKLSGNIKISDIKTGIVKIGFGDVGIFDQHRSRTIWEVSGRIEFKGKANIGHGSKLSIRGTLILGKEFAISAESSIVATNSISIGDHVLVAWDSLIMDTDFHKIYDFQENQINFPMPVTIGNGVWIGCKTLVLKGVNIPDGVVVAAGSTVSRSIHSQNAIVAGNPVMVIKEGIRWSQ